MALLLPVPFAGQQGDGADDPSGVPGSASSTFPASTAADGSSRPLRVLDVPYLPQSEALCGGAAAAMVMRYWGDDRVEPGRFAGLVRPREGGIRPGELTAEIRRLGWRAARVAGSLDAVRRHLEDGRPVIMLIRVGRDRYHYVAAVAAHGSEWLVHDPARAPYRRVGAGELLERWEASGRWALVVVPDRSGADGAGKARPGGGSRPGARRAFDLASVDDRRCGGRVAAAVRAARSDRTARADSLLRTSIRRCPASAAARRELAGLRFRQGRWRASASLAEDAVAADPGDVHALRTLAAARYMAGEEADALAAWNRLDEPRVSGLRVYGLRHTRYRPLRRQLGLTAGRPLSPGGLRAARRRAAAVPSVASSRVGYRAPAEGRTELEVALLERPLLPSSPAGIVGLGARAAANRELRVDVASPLGGGELWTVSWSWWEERPRVEVGVEAPGLVGLPGVWGVRGSWRRAAFRRFPEAGDAPAPDPVREEVRRAEVSFARWTAGSLRLEAAAMLEDWTRRGRRAGVGVGARLRGPTDRLALRARAEGRVGPGSDSWRGGLEARGRWMGPGASRLRVRTGLEAAGPGSPRMLWPGAGTGHVRRPLLRAHPLVEGGVVTGPAFGRLLSHGGVEIGMSLPLSLHVPVRLAVFTDVARAWRGSGAGAGRILADGGVGIRLGLPGGGRLRLDAATGLADGADAVSVAWEGPWPGR